MANAKNANCVSIEGRTVPYMELDWNSIENNCLNRIIKLCF
jgi:hypothetical protein